MSDRLPDPRSKISKGGFTLLELTASGVLMAAALVLCAQLIGWIVLERRTADRRYWATQEVSNVIEYLAAYAGNPEQSAAVQAVQLSPQARELLPGAELHTDVTELETEPPAKQITVELKWRNRGGEFDAPVRVRTWVYRSGGAVQ